jgi:hypothetical protein
MDRTSVQSWLARSRIGVPAAGATATGYSAGISANRPARTSQRSGA